MGPTTGEVESEVDEGAGARATRRRLDAAGPAALEAVELLALVLDGGHARPSSLVAAGRLLDAAGGLPRLGRSDADFAVAMGVRWRRAAARVRAALELGRRAATVPIALASPVRDAGVVFEHFRGRLPQLDRERFFTLLLDGRNRLLAEVCVCEGSLTAALVHPREVFAPAIRASAAAIVLAHNHPSGDPTPSAEDQALTVRLRQAGELLGIRVLDHVVVAQGRYASMASLEGW